MFHVDIYMVLERNCSPVESTFVRVRRDFTKREACRAIIFHAIIFVFFERAAVPRSVKPIYT